MTSEVEFGCSISTLADHSLLGNGFLLDAERRPVIYRGNAKPSPISRRKRRQVAVYRMLSRAWPSQMDKVTWVCRPNAQNYYHWMIGTLPRLYFLKQIGWREPIAISHCLLKRKWVRELITLFPEQNFVFVRHFRKIDAKTVFAVHEGAIGPVPMPNGLILRKMAKDLLAFGGAEQPNSDFRRIHISRQKHKRKIANIADVRGVLDRFDFKEINLEEFPLAQQFNILAKAEVVFGPHGAGLANIIFMPEGGKVLEVRQKQLFHQDALFPQLSHSLGLHHHVIRSEHSRGRNDDLFVNPTYLQSRLEAILG